MRRRRVAGAGERQVRVGQRRARATTAIHRVTRSHATGSDVRRNLTLGTGVGHDLDRRGRILVNADVVGIGLGVMSPMASSL